ncbi:hypothetical protein HY989_05915 [Candidatus Micrarchaeota archaeon]|nr:hypothetical protein [Candidatus Micrarchaeota archaeon]
MFDEEPKVKQFVGFMYILASIGLVLVAIGYFTSAVIKIPIINSNLGLPTIFFSAIFFLMGGAYALLKGFFAIKEKETVILFEFGGSTFWSVPIHQKGWLAITTGIIYLALGAAILNFGLFLLVSLVPNGLVAK